MNGVIAILAGIWIFLILLLVAMYVLSSIASMKALNLLGYQNAWMAWVPFLRYYALTDATGYTTVDLNCGLNIDMSIFRFWWALLFILPWIPAIGSLAEIALTILCMGWVYGILFAKLDGKDTSETKLLGYIAAFVGLVAIVKFLTASPIED